MLNSMLLKYSTFINVDTNQPGNKTQALFAISRQCYLLCYYAIPGWDQIQLYSGYLPVYHELTALTDYTKGPSMAQKYSF